MAEEQRDSLAGHGRDLVDMLFFESGNFEVVAGGSEYREAFRFRIVPGDGFGGSGGGRDRGLDTTSSQIDSAEERGSGCSVTELGIVASQVGSA